MWAERYKNKEVDGAQGWREQWDFIFCMKCRMSYQWNLFLNVWHKYACLSKPFKHFCIWTTGAHPSLGEKLNSPVSDPDDCLGRRSIVSRLVGKLYPSWWELLNISNFVCDLGEGSYCIANFTPQKICHYYIHCTCSGMVEGTVLSKYDIRVYSVSLNSLIKHAHTYKFIVWIHQKYLKNK